MSSTAILAHARFFSNRRPQLSYLPPLPSHGAFFPLGTRENPSEISHHAGSFSLSLSNGSGGCGGKLQPTLFAGSLLLPFRIMRPSYSSANLFHTASVLFLLVPVRARAIYTNRVSFVVVLTAGQFIVVCCTLPDAVSLLSSHRRISRFLLFSFLFLN